MKKIIFLFVFIFPALSVKAQYLGVIGGGNINSIYNSRNEHTTHNSERAGYSVGIACDVFKIAPVQLRITGRFHQFYGNISGRSGGMGGGSTYVFDYNKQNISFGLHLLNKRDDTKLRYSLGIEYYYLLDEKFTGSRRFSSMHASDFNTFDESSYSLSEKGIIALTTSFGIEKNLSPTMYIIPQLSLHLGLKNEFSESQYYLGKPKALRFFFEVGIFRRIKKI